MNQSNVIDHSFKEIIIKKASLQNLGNLIDWRMEVLYEVFSIPPDANTHELKQANRMYYEKALEKEEHIACFASHGQKIVGCGGICLYQEMPSPDNPSGLCGYLMNIYTRPAFRHCGVGRKIVQWLTDQAIEKGITKIYLETSEAGRSMYQAMGFEEMSGLLQLKNR